MSREPTFRAVRRRRMLHFLAQAVLLLTLFGGLNYLAGFSGWRFDLTAHHRHSLSAETLVYLKNLTSDVTIVSTFDRDVDGYRNAARDVAELLGEYERATARNPPGHRITKTALNVVQNAREARKLGVDESNLIVAISGGRRRPIEPNELYLVQKNGATPETTAFLGEKALTAAILDVTNPAKKKIYFTSGHGELPLTGPESTDMDHGLSLFRDQLVSRNYAYETLDLSQNDVPADAALVIIAGPQGRFHDDESVRLRRYLSTARAGRLLALLGPGVKHNLDELLLDWGVLTDDVLVMDNSTAGQNDTGELILSASIRDDHPVIQQLSVLELPVRFGAARIARPFLGHDNGFNVTALIGTSPGAWGERNYAQPGNVAPVFTPNVDARGPLTIGTASERVPTGGKSSVPSGRVVVFGGVDWVANGRLQNPGNGTLLLASVNWLVERDSLSAALGTVPPRPIERIQLTLTQQQLVRLRYTLIFALPGAAALLGLSVFWFRRR